MIVRELLTKMGFQTDEASLERLNASINAVKGDMDKAAVAGEAVGAAVAKGAGLAEHAFDSEKQSVGELAAQLEKTASAGVAAGAASAEGAGRAERALDSEKHSAGELGGQLDKTASAGDAAGNAVAKGAKQAKRELANTKQSVRELGSQLGRLAQWAAAAFGVHKLAETADAYISASARLGMAAEKLGETQGAVEHAAFNTAMDTRSNFEATAGFMYKVSGVAAEQGKSLGEVQRAVEAVNAGLVVGGASAHEATATIQQLGQALQSGVLQGDEMRSLTENAGTLAEVLAKELGYKGVGALREAGSEGKITSEQLMKALVNSSAAMKEQLAKMPMTFGQVIENLRTRFSRFTGNIEKKSGIFSRTAKAMDDFFDMVERGADKAAEAVGGYTNLLKAMGVAIAVVMGTKFVAWIWKAVTAMRALGVAGLFASWPLLLVAAGIALALLAADDFYRWMQGRPSILGDWLGDFNEFMKKVDEFKAKYSGLISTLEDWRDLYMAPIKYTNGLYQATKGLIFGGQSSESPIASVPIPGAWTGMEEINPLGPRVDVSRLGPAVAPTVINQTNHNTISTTLPPGSSVVDVQGTNSAAIADVTRSGLGDLSLANPNYRYMGS